MLPKSSQKTHFEISKRNYARDVRAERVVIGRN